MLKIFYNGFKVSGGNFQKFGKLQRYWISNSNRIDGKKGFTIYARDYEGFSKEVRDYFSVVNNTEIQTDYFEKDKIFVEAGSKYFNEINEAFNKGQNHIKVARATR